MRQKEFQINEKNVDEQYLIKSKTIHIKIINNNKEKRKRNSIT